MYEPIYSLFTLCIYILCDLYPYLYDISYHSLRIYWNLQFTFFAWGPHTLPTLTTWRFCALYLCEYGPLDTCVTNSFSMSENSLFLCRHTFLTFSLAAMVSQLTGKGTWPTVIQSSENVYEYEFFVTKESLFLM